jgi:hypothetical protein
LFSNNLILTKKFTKIRFLKIFHFTSHHWHHTTLFCTKKFIKIRSLKKIQFVFVFQNFFVRIKLFENKLLKKLYFLKKTHYFFLSLELWIKIVGQMKFFFLSTCRPFNKGWYQVPYPSSTLLFFSKNEHHIVCIVSGLHVSWTKPSPK